jgi:hypothetical protein
LHREAYALKTAAMQQIANSLKRRLIDDALAAAEAIV